MGLCIRPRPQHRDIEMPELAMVAEPFAGPRGNQDIFRLLQTLLRLVMVDAEALVIVDVVRRTAAETDD
jgi:hypothetical protein